MRIQTYFLLLSSLAFGAVVSGCDRVLPQNAADKPVTIEVDGAIITLESGVNVRPDIYEAALNPEFVANNDWELVDGYWDVRPRGVVIPLEAAQLILPDGHPEFPSDMPWVVAAGEIQPIEVPIPLVIPASWQGLYDVRIEGDSVYYDFVLDPDQPTKLFSITALTEAGWQAVQNEPHGESIFSYGGIVWVYNPALENAYSGELADRFSELVGEAYGIAQSLKGFFSSQLTPESALPVLQSYFDVLVAGNYAEAARMYGGDYELLAGYNPDIAASDQAALFERACTVNGFICNLEIGSIVKTEQLSDREVQFTLTLQNPDGSTFELGPCCEADTSNAAVRREFVYTVALPETSFLVMELPVYMP